jgi:hypothetical protein
MKFNKNRFAKLAGLPRTRGTLNESRRRSAMRRGLLSEAKHSDIEEVYTPMNIGYDDMDGYGDDEMYDDMGGYDDMGTDLAYDDGMDYDMMYEGEEEESEEDVKEEMVEIDDVALMKEVRNIKKQRINEERLKAVIEDELKNVMAEMQYGSSWMYGGNKPTRSRKGQVTRGFRGLGFK